MVVTGLYSATGLFTSKLWRTESEKMSKTTGFLQLIRPLNCTMMAFAVVVGAALVAPLNFTVNLLLGVVTAFSLTAASMVINDYYDREIDAINEPNRPIPRGSVKPKEALVMLQS